MRLILHLLALGGDIHSLMGWSDLFSQDGGELVQVHRLSHVVVKARF